MRLFCCPFHARRCFASAPHASETARHSIADSVHRTFDARVWPAIRAESIARCAIPTSNGDDSTVTAPVSPSMHRPVACRDDGVAPRSRVLAGDTSPLARHARSLARESPPLAHHVTGLALASAELARESP